MSARELIRQMLEAAAQCDRDRAEWAALVRAEAAAMDRPTRRIAFCGGLKSGRTSILNSLLGFDILPVRSTPATSVATALAYDVETVLEEAVQNGEDVEWRPIPLAGLHDAILFREGQPEPSQDRIAVRLKLPIPWLRDGLVIDTVAPNCDAPGLAHSMRLLESADLAVYVIAADAILPEWERQCIRALHERLSGSVLFVLNRLALVDCRDRRDVRSWVQAKIPSHGNHLLGRPALYTVECSLATPVNRAVATHTDAGMAALRCDVLRILETAIGVRLAEWGALSRLRKRLPVISRMAEREGAPSAVIRRLRDIGQEVSRFLENIA